MKFKNQWKFSQMIKATKKMKILLGSCRSLQEHQKHHPERAIGITILSEEAYQDQLDAEAPLRGKRLHRTSSSHLLRINFRNTMISLTTSMNSSILKKRVQTYCGIFRLVKPIIKVTEWIRRFLMKMTKKWAWLTKGKFGIQRSFVLLSNRKTQRAKRINLYKTRDPSCQKRSLKFKDRKGAKTQEARSRAI